MIKNLVIFLISVYQNTFSKLAKIVLGSVCCFEPSCSEYAKQVIRKYGLSQGLILAIKRLGKCHPFSSTYFDPVP